MIAKMLNLRKEKNDPCMSKDNQTEANDELCTLLLSSHQESQLGQFEKDLDEYSMSPNLENSMTSMLSSNLWLSCFSSGTIESGQEHFVESSYSLLPTRSSSVLHNANIPAASSFDGEFSESTLKKTLALSDTVSGADPEKIPMSSVGTLQSLNASQSSFLEEINARYCTDSGNLLNLHAVKNVSLISATRDNIYLNAKDVQSLVVGLSSRTFTISNAFPRSCKIITSSILPDLSSNMYAETLFSLCKFHTHAKNFCIEVKASIPEDCVLHGVATGIEACLECYENAIATVELDGMMPISVIAQYYSGLVSHTSKLIQLCTIFEDIRKDYKGNIFLDQYGIHIIEQIYDELEKESLMPCPNLFTVLILKYCFNNYYLRFLQKWLFEGIFLMNHMEWGFQTCFTHLPITDEKFWTNHFHDDIDVNNTSLPCIFKAYRSSILSAGKSICLLKQLNTHHPLFSTSVDMPTLCMFFSNEDADEMQAKHFLIMLARLKFLLKNPDILSIGASSNITEIWKNIIIHIGINENLLKVQENFKQDACIIEDKCMMNSQNIDCLNIPSLSITAKMDEGMPQVNLSWIDDFPTHDRLLNMLIAHIAINLKEDSENIQSLIKDFTVTRLTETMEKSVFPVINTQLELIHRCILHTLFVNHELHVYLEEVRDIFFKNDRHFFLTFQEHISQAVQGALLPTVFLTPMYIQYIMSNTLDEHKFHGKLILEAPKVPKFVPESAIVSGHQYASYLHLVYEVGFPQHIIFTKDIMARCSQILILLVQVQYFITYLNDVFNHFKHVRRTRIGINTSKQYRTLYFFSQQMFLFASAITDFLNMAIHEIKWPKFLSSLKNVKNIDDLRSAFFYFVQDIFEICLLGESDLSACNVLFRMLDKTFFYNMHLLEGCWKYKKHRSAWVHSHFEKLFKHYEKFKVDQRIILTAFFKNSKSDDLIALYHTIFQFMD